MKSKILSKILGPILCVAMILSAVAVGVTSVAADTSAITGPTAPYMYTFVNGGKSNAMFWYYYADETSGFPTLRLGETYRLSYYYYTPDNSTFPGSCVTQGPLMLQFFNGAESRYIKLTDFAERSVSADRQWFYEEITVTVGEDLAGRSLDRLAFTVQGNQTEANQSLTLADIRFCKVENGVAGDNLFGPLCEKETFSAWDDNKANEGIWYKVSGSIDSGKLDGGKQLWLNGWTARMQIDPLNADQFKRPVTTCDVKDSEGNTLATVNVGDALDLSTLTLPVRDGYWFAGYYTDAACTQPFATGTAISEDTTLYYGWVDAADFDILGVQVRLTEPNGLRFMCRAKTSMLEQLEALNAQESSMSFGMLLQPENKMTNPAFTREDATTSKYLVDRNADNYAQKDEHTYFNAVVIDIPEARYAATVVLRSYVTYLDASGVERTYYNASYTSATLTDSPYAVASLVTAAQATLDADAAETDAAKKLSDAAKARLEEIISKSSNA